MVVNPTRGDQKVQITLENVMHVPEVNACYFSVSTLLHKGGKIIFEGNGFTIYVQDWKIVQGYLENNLFWFDISKLILHVHSSTSTPLEIWHQCMGHLSYSTLMCYHDSIKGMSFDTSTDHD